MVPPTLPIHALIGQALSTRGIHAIWPERHDKDSSEASVGEVGVGVVRELLRVAPV